MSKIGYAALIATLSVAGCGSAALDELGSGDSRSSDDVNEPGASDPGSLVPSSQDPSGEDPLGEDPVAQNPPVADPPVADPPVADPPVSDPPVTNPPPSDPPVTDPPTDDPVDLPPATCSAPAGPIDTSNPTSVVGNGTSGSCTEAALRDAVSRGGIITFDCGSSVKTINISQTLVAPSSQDTTIDGSHKIILDGGGDTQILRAYDGDWRNNQRTLTVQRLVMQRGHDTGTGYLPRNGDSVCAWGYRDGGGGAIFTRNVNVHIWGVTFLDNEGPAIGPDVAGGAVYVLGSIELVVTNSVFRGNSASNGGAIGVLHTSSYMYNVIFEGNAATGMLANYAGGDAAACPVFNHSQQGGAGGLGGAYYIDGLDPEVVFCGVEMSNNISGDLGGAVFASRYWGTLGDRQTITWEKSTFNGNYSPTGGGGAAYVNGAYFTLTDCSFDGNSAGDGDGGALKLTGITLNANNVTFTNNTSVWGGAVAHWEGGPEGAGTATNLSFSGNNPNDFVGDFPAP